MSSWAPGSTLLAGIFLSTLQYPAPTVPNAWATYASALHEGCAEKHRERLSRQDLAYQIDRFTDRLPAAEQRSIKSTVVLSCSSRRSGRDCDLDGFMLAALQLGEIDRFAARVCETPPRPPRRDFVWADSH